MKKRRRFKKILILPPVILAAIFVWLLAGQWARSRTVVLGETISDRRRAETPSGPASDRLLKIEIGKEGEDGGDGGSGPGGGPPGLEAGHREDGGLSLLFAGDIYLSDHVLNAYDRAGGISGVLDEGLRQEITDADIFMANQEFPFSDRGSPMADKQFTFRLPTVQISVLQEIGPDIVTLANNHILDYGQEALLDTCTLLDQAGILRVGAGADLEGAKRPEVVEVKGKRIGFLGASRVIPVGSWAAGASHPGVLSTYDPSILLTQIKELRPSCDYLVVYVHWGIERNTTPEEYQRSLAKQYIDAGADLVVGSHPHVLQGIEYYKGKPILYSLGNFVFGSVIPETMLVKVELNPDGTIDLSVMPATSSAGYTRRMDAAKQPGFYQRIQGLSFGITVDGEGKILPVQ